MATYLVHVDAVPGRLYPLVPTLLDVSRRGHIRGTRLEAPYCCVGIAAITRVTRRLSERGAQGAAGCSAVYTERVRSACDSAPGTSALWR